MGPQIPQRLTDQTAERLLHMIGSDPAYRPGAKLPNEPRLCELFGVSRTTLREAVRSLAAQGYGGPARKRHLCSGPCQRAGHWPAAVGKSPVPACRGSVRNRMMIEPQAARLACLPGHR